MLHKVLLFPKAITINNCYYHYQLRYLKYAGINNLLISLQNTRKKFESTRDQLAHALYEKGLALAEIESLKVRAFILILIIILATFVYFPYNINLNNMKNQAVHIAKKFHL